MELTFAGLMKRALLAGLVAGITLAGYTLAVSEPTVDRAIAVESARNAQNHVQEDEPIFNRTQQKGGAVAASLLYGLLIGGVFGAVFAAVRHRLAAATDRGRALTVAAVAFAATVLLPAVKYPPNPPGIGEPGTIGRRTIQYAVLLAVGVLGAILLAGLSRWLRAHVGPHHHLPLMVLATIAFYVVVILAMPATPDPIPATYPAGLLWQFRLRSLGGLALFWLSLGTTLAWLLERSDRRDATDVVPPRVAARR